MKKFINKLKTMEGYLQLKGVSEEKVKEAEESLGLIFADEYRNYLREVGAATANGFEFTGITDSKRLNVLDVTIEARKLVNMPNDLYVVKELGVDGIVLCQSSSGAIFQASIDKQVIKVSDSLYDLISN